MVLTYRSAGGAGSVVCRGEEIYDYYLRTCVSARPNDQRCPHGYAYNVISGMCEGKL